MTIMAENRARIFLYTIISVFTIVAFLTSPVLAATPFFANDGLTRNGIEWCEENHMLYDIMGLRDWLKHHDYSIESRVCAHLYHHPAWEYAGEDRYERLIVLSREFVQAEIEESLRESKTGIIDVKPAELEDIVLYRPTQDGTITIKTVTSEPVRGKPLLVAVTFLKEAGIDELTLLPNVNYDISISQNGTNILTKNGEYDAQGSIEYTTKPLPTSDPVDIKIRLLGVGRNMPFSETFDETISFHVVPEFGATVMILGFTIILVTVLGKFKPLKMHNI